MASRSLSEIQERIACGNAVVLTAQEVCDMVKGGGEITLKDVDVVTSATRAIMSGTYAILSLPVAEPHSFVRANRAWINGISTSVGPCPNERLGMVDLMLFGTTHSKDDSSYGGGHLFRELVAGNEILVEVEANDGRLFSRSVEMDDIPYAHLFSTRNAFKNYVAFVNPQPTKVSTIFHARGFDTSLGGATVSGCGQINPVKCDPYLETIGLGTRILMNGAEGFVVGTGTRSSSARPNLMGIADMRCMDPDYMGGFITAAGAECISSWAVPIPVLNDSILECIKSLDRETPLPIMDVNIREIVEKTTYGDVWSSCDLEITFDPERCAGCKKCTVEPACPMRAVTLQEGNIKRDKSRCFNCGLCITQCSSGAFSGNLGSINFGCQKVPIVLRQSDKARALKLAESLKKSILDGSFKMTQMVEKI
jgi:putative methanogenesis marker 16 metalloprotein